MSGGVDPLYARARSGLLDALEALRDQLPALILVGAQAIYLHTGEGDLAVAPFTTDADLALDPGALHAEPKLAEALRGAGFVEKTTLIGTWTSSRAGIDVDLMVPAAVGGAGRRGARLGEHGNTVARKTRGLEAALIDRRVQTIRSLAAVDPRQFEVAVAGPAALLIAKLHKLHERLHDANRRNDKDALDVYRLLRAIDTQDLASAYKVALSDPRAGEVAQQARTYLELLFGAQLARGAAMAARAAMPLIDPDEVTAACAALARDLLGELAD